MTKLLSQEEGATLRAGDVVNWCQFSPRKPKEGEVLTREWGGRTEYLDYKWKNRVLECEPYPSAHDGLVVRFVGCMGAWLVSSLELVSRNPLT